VLLLLLSLSLFALVSYCVFHRNLLFSYSATQPQGWNKTQCVCVSSEGDDICLQDDDDIDNIQHAN